MPGRFGSLEAFRDAVVRLGFPLTEHELQRLWEMVLDLRTQADGLRAFLEEQAGSNPLNGPATGSRAR